MTEKKTFKITKNSKYYISESIAEKAKGFDSMNSYIQYLQETSEKPILMRQDDLKAITEKLDDLEFVLIEKKPEKLIDGFEQAVKSMRFLERKLKEAKSEKKELLEQVKIINQAINLIQDKNLLTGK